MDDKLNTPATKKELCARYGISYHVLRIWLQDHAQEIGPYKGGYYTSKQVKKIRKILE